MPTLKQNRRDFLTALGSTALATTLGPTWVGAADAKRQPNIVLIYADDLDFDEVPGYAAATMPCNYAHYRQGKSGVGKGPGLLMPTIERLLTQGARFDRFYITSSVCTPSRYGLLTGRYASRCPGFVARNPAGTHATIRWNTPLGKRDATLAKALQSAGYTTGMVGKWHNFPGLGGKLKDKRFPLDGDPREPELAAALAKRYRIAQQAVRDCGFDYAEAVHIGNTEHVHPKALQGHNPEWMAAEGRKFVEANRAKPFFLYLPLSLPHGGYNTRWMLQADPLATTSGMLDTPPDSDMPSRQEIIKRVKDAGLDQRQAMGTWLDECVGAVVRKIDQLGLGEDTLILFVSDHQSRGKYTCYEACRAPAVAYWPGRIPAGHVVKSVCANIDVAPALLDLAGGKRPAEMSDGHSFLPMLLGKPEPADWRQSILLEVGNTRAVVAKRWKYIANRVPEETAKKMSEDIVEAKRLGRRRMVGWDGAKNWHPWQQKKGGIVYNSDKLYPCYFDADQLYDLEADVLEQRNLAADPAHADVLADMKQQLDQLITPLPHTFGEFGKKKGQE